MSRSWRRAFGAGGEEDEEQNDPQQRKKTSITLPDVAHTITRKGRCPTCTSTWGVKACANATANGYTLFVDKRNEDLMGEGVALSVTWSALVMVKFHWPDVVSW